MSVLKFQDQSQGHAGSKLYWHRAGIDGLPFRGNNPPLYTEEEFDARVVKVADSRNGTFDTTDPEQNKLYLKVLEGIANSWFQLIFIDRWRDEGSNKQMVYIEWLEYFLEDGSPARAISPGEASYGQSGLPPTS